jgi:hypothetical protein
MRATSCSVVRFWLTAGLVLVALALAGPAVSAQCWEEKIPWTSEADAEYGAAVAAGQDVVVVGAPKHTQPGLGQAGAVYVSRRVGSSWSTTSLPLPTGLATGDRFGHAVAINEAGTVIAVGAPFNDTLAFDGGLLMIYEWDAPTQSWKVAAEWPGVFVSGLYGAAVDAHSDLIVVGEPAGAFGNGAVNIYRRTGPLTWVSDGFFSGFNFLDGFGWAVALTFSRLAIGSPFEDSGANDAGVIRFYEHDGNGWVLRDGYLSSGAEAHFGASVDMDGDHAVVGEPEADIGGATDAGAVHFFRWVGSTVTQTGAIATGGTGQRMGFAVAIHGFTAAVGVPWSPGAFGKPLGDGAGLAQVYHWDGTDWAAPSLELVTAKDVTDFDHYGSALALYDRWIAVGAPFSDDLGADSGVVYVRDMNIGGTYADLGFGLSGTGALVPRLSGTGALCGNTTVTLSLEDALPNSVAFLVLGITTLYVPFKGGTMVPDNTLIMGGYGTGTPGAIHLTGFWPPIAPALTLYAQYWVFDPAGPVGWSASNGLLFASSGG